MIFNIKKDLRDKLKSDKIDKWESSLVSDNYIRYYVDNKLSIDVNITYLPFKTQIMYTIWDDRGLPVDDLLITNIYNPFLNIRIIRLKKKLKIISEQNRLKEVYKKWSRSEIIKSLNKQNN